MTYATVHSTLTARTNAVPHPQTGGDDAHGIGWAVLEEKPASSALLNREVRIARLEKALRGLLDYLVAWGQEDLAPIRDELNDGLRVDKLDKPPPAEPYPSFSLAKLFKQQTGGDDAHGIGWAVKHMQAGYRVRRAGWNGKGMWLRLEGVRSGRYLPYVMMTTAQGEFVPWVCSQTDILAVDWELAD